MSRNHLILGAFVTAGALVFGTAPTVAAPVEATTTSSVGAPAASSVAPRSLAEAAPDQAEVTHKPWRQKRPSWCSPTSVQLSLRTFGVKVTQDTLAEQMNTDSVGTDAADLNRVYNGYLNDLGYEMNRVDGRDPEVLMDAVAHDVGVLGKAVPMGIRGSQASWIDTDSNFGHVVSVRGYDRGAGTITIWDPSADGYGGHHVVSVADLAKASQQNGLAFVTKP